MIKQIDKDMAQLALKYALIKEGNGVHIVLKWYKENIDSFSAPELDTLLQIKKNLVANKGYLSNIPAWTEWVTMIHNAYKVK